MFTEEEIEYEINRAGRQSNPKWDDKIWGYKTFSADQKEFLRGEAIKRLEEHERAYQQLAQELGPRAGRRIRRRG